MATATTTKRRKRARKATVKNTLTDLNLSMINSSEELIENTLLTGEKYQKLFAKTLKKSEPLVGKQVDIMFDTIESIKDQFDFGTVRFKKLIGWNDKTIKNFRKNATKSITSFRKNAEEKIEDIQEEITSRVTSTPAKVKKTVSPKAKSRKVTSTKVKDLKVIDGIGPKMEKILHAGGIKTVDALAKASISKIERVIEKSGSNFRAINPESWLAQAKKIAK